MAARVPDGSGGEAAPNRSTTSRKRRAIVGNGPAQSLAAITGCDRGAIRLRGQEPDEEDDPGFCAAAQRAVAINRANARGTRGRKTHRGTPGKDVPGDSCVVAFTGR